MGAGISWVAVAVLLMLVGIVVVDLVFELRGWRPIGSRVQVWARQYPLFSAGLIVLLGALLGHFFWN